MRIERMKLENFQGIRGFEIMPGGRDVSVSGRNGTGKSTLANAFCWLLYDKPYTEEKGYTPQTVGTHGLDHSAEMTVTLDGGTEKTLRKVYHEVYKTKRGNAEKAFAGYTTDYEIDGVPMKKADYDKAVQEMCGSEKEAMLLTRHGYFLEQMKVDERRRLLLEMCGGIDDAAVVASDGDLAGLPEVLAGRTVDDYLTVAKAQKRKIDAELKAIPERIDEAEKAKPTDPADEGELLASIASKEARLDGLKHRKTEDGAEAERQKELARLKVAWADAEAAHTTEWMDRINEETRRIRRMESEAEAFAKSAYEARLKAEGLRREAETMAAKRDALLAEYSAEKGKEWEGGDTCPTCGQKLPQEAIDSAVAAFNRRKAEALERIKAEGLAVSKELVEKKALEAESVEKEAELAAANEKEMAERVREAKASKSEMPPFAETEKAKEIDARMAELAAARTIKAADPALDAEIQECEKELFLLKQKVAECALAEKMEKRIAELMERQARLGAEYEELERGVWLCEVFNRKKASMLDSKVNERFGTLKFRLSKEQVNGGIADDCEALIECGNTSVPYKSANNAARVNAGLEAMDVLGEYFQRELPIWVDNCEAVNAPVKTRAQQIRLYVSEGGDGLRCEYTERMD